MRVTTSLWAFLLVSHLDLITSETQTGAFLEPYDLLFDKAVEAYYKQDWLSVILNMERALRNKHTLTKIKSRCRITCANNTAFGEHVFGLGSPVPGTGTVQDLAFFQRVLKRAECVNACETDKLGPRTLHKVSGEIESEFKKRSPYNYLQVAYFKVRPCLAGPRTLDCPGVDETKHRSVNPNTLTARGQYRSYNQI